MSDPELALALAALDAAPDLAPELAGPQLERALEVLRARAPQSSNVARALNLLGLVRRRAGLLDVAWGLHAEARAEAAAAGDLRQQALAARNQADVERTRGRPGATLHLLRECAELLAADGDGRGAASAWRALAAQAIEAGRLGVALDASAREVAVRESGEPAALATALTSQADLLARVGRRTEALRAIERAAAVRRSAGDAAGAAASALPRAALLLDLGRPLAARRALEAATELPRELEPERARLLAESDLARLDAHTAPDDPLRALAEPPGGDPTPRDDLVLRARRLAEEALRAMPGLPPARRALARARAHAGDADAARELAAETDLEHLERAAVVAEGALAASESPVPALRLWAALVRLRAGDGALAALTRARALARRAVELDPEGAASFTRALDALEPRARVSAPSAGVLLRGADEAARREVGALASGGVEQALLDLRRLQEVGKALNSDLEMDPLLDLIIDVALELTGAERGFLVLVGDGQQVTARVARKVDRAEVEHTDRTLSSTIVREALANGRTVVVDDAARDPRFQEADSVQRQGLRSVVAARLHERGRTTGAIYLDHRQRPALFDRRAVGLLESLCDQAAVALAAARVRREREQALRDLEEERARLRARVEVQERAIVDLGKKIVALGDQGDPGEGLGALIGRSPAMQALYRVIDKARRCDVPVLIHGESGTGKELVARAIHEGSARAKGPLVSENVAALPDTTAESELFGHVQGAFTGADRDRVGLFERAAGGTLFLDEVGEMSPRIQGEMLRVLETHEVRPLGARDPVSVDFRLITATHRDLKALVADGVFRQDLFFRLHVLPIEVPPLRDRPEDIPLLAQHLLERCTLEHGLPPRRFEEGALRRLQSLRWEGNVRELRNTIERAALLSPDELIRGDDVTLGSRREDVDALEDLTLAAWDEAKEAFARRYLLGVMKRVQGNVSQAARETGIVRTALQRLLKRYGVDASSFRQG